MTPEAAPLTDGPDAPGVDRRRLLAGAQVWMMLCASSLGTLTLLGRVDPELLLPYLLQRRGRSQDNILALLEPMIAEGQADGTVRDGDPALMARSIMLAAHGFTLSAETMADDAHPVEEYDEELRLLIERYLAP